MYFGKRKTDELASDEIADEYVPLHDDHQNAAVVPYTEPSTSYQRAPYPQYVAGQPLDPIYTGETWNPEEEDAGYFNQYVHPAYPDDQASGTSPVGYSRTAHYATASLVTERPAYRDTASYNNTQQSYSTQQPYLNHFDYDTEAYASGIHSLPTYRPPRSRSPTPAVDDEDYHIVGDTSFHYTGSDSRSRGLSSSHTGGDTFFTGESHQSERNYGQDDDDDEDDDDDDDDEGTCYNSHSSHHQQKPHAYQNPAEYNVFPNMQRQATSSSSGTYMEPNETRHFGPAPIGRVTRRHKKQRIRLTQGNLIVDLKIPLRLPIPVRQAPENQYTRYTAVTCDPDEFKKRGFFLRQIEYKRETELFVVITLYNEDEILFCRTLYAVMQNISHLTTRKNSQRWGPNSWEKVVVCIVADGRKKIHPRVLDVLTLLGVYQEGGHMKSGINKQEVQAHLFEYTTTFGLDADLKLRFPDKKVLPTQIIFCMKEKNQKKINSHRWFFNAFAAQLQPNVCILLDAGTMPAKTSLYKLWKAFDLNSNVAGACGEIAVYKGKAWSLLLNPLVAAQNFEYKISSILDKPTESMFGYISVLPGAFSAYRYIALQNHADGTGPLASYFKGEVLHGHDTDIFTSNMYLAEDRILCFELVAKARSHWVLKYVKGATAETDVPDGLPEFISQRRRWLNGSFFAAIYSIAHTGQLLRSGHSLARKVALAMETLYTIINLTFAWFAIGNFFLFFIIVTSSLEDEAFNMSWIKYLNTPIQYLLGSIVVACFLFSMGNRPRASKWKYQTAAILYALLMIYLLFASVMCAIVAARQGGSTNSLMLFSVVITYGLYVASSILAFDPWHILTSSGAYLLLSPTFINILSIYAFSNLDDISWGTKQDDTPESDLGAVFQDALAVVEVEDEVDKEAAYEDALDNIRYRKPLAARQITPAKTQAEVEQNAKDYYANVRTNVLLLWALSNGILLVGILGSGSPSQTFTEETEGTNLTRDYMIFILAFTAITNIIRFTASTLYLLIVFVTG